MFAPGRHVRVNRGIGSNTSLKLINNIIFLNKNFNDKLDLTLSEEIAHESGHNIAAAHSHNTGNYEYNQIGLQSNTSKNLKVTYTNVINVINAPVNRKTIKE